LAGFQVIMYGRFSVITEGRPNLLERRIAQLPEWPTMLE
jgi:hypothetical protein